jgi:hypothetical protein
MWKLAPHHGSPIFYRRWGRIFPLEKHRFTSNQRSQILLSPNRWPRRDERDGCGLENSTAVTPYGTWWLDGLGTRYPVAGRPDGGARPAGTLAASPHGSPHLKLTSSNMAGPAGGGDGWMDGGGVPCTGRWRTLVAYMISTPWMELLPWLMVMAGLIDPRSSSLCGAAASCCVVT